MLVLDDYHLIENAAIAEALTYSVDNAPPALRLVVATRADPPLPLPRWRARQQLVEIRADELRFTPVETDEFLRTSLTLALDAQDLATLDARAEGWIVAPALSPDIAVDSIGAAATWVGIITVCLIWQFVLAMIIVYRQEGDLRWATVRRCLWLDAPREPRTGRTRRRLWVRNSCSGACSCPG